ncbi:hypothetical protein BGX34_003433 [Mortierella sp. NVP85]|nr:hypothetical protein BGX34_003433 [Mortierella sp. NVP85]
MGNWMKGFLGFKTPQPKGSELRPFPASIKGQPIVETLPAPQEELEHERKQLEKELEKRAREIRERGKVVEVGTRPDEPQESIPGSSKELDEKVSTNKAVGPKSTSKSGKQTREETEAFVESKNPVSSKSIRHQRRQEKNQQALEAAVTFVKKQGLSWRARRALRKAEEKRLQEIKATQDIGRYSLLYELGGYMGLDQWRQNLLAPTDAQPEPYED